MKSNDLPFGSQFTPNVINLRELLIMARDNEGMKIKDFNILIANKYWPDSNSKIKLAGNTKISMTSYGLLSDGDIHLTDFGHELLNKTDDNELFKAFGKHILLNLNGLLLVDTIRRMYLNGESITNATLNTALQQLGFQLQQTSNNAQVMKLWLGKAGVILDNWKIDEAVLKDILGIDSSDIAIYKELTPEQYYFMLALCNSASDERLSATDVRELATASFNIEFDQKSFATRVIKPLQDKNLIDAEKATSGRGAKPYMVKLTDVSKAEILQPMLDQFKEQVGNALAEAYCKSFKELHEDIQVDDTYKKGLALEAFAIKVMRIIGLNFIKTRYRDIQIGGAEVDVLFDSTRLLYTRWQVQCKNTAHVNIDMVAKEVGLSHMLKSNAIVIMTTGHLTSDAKKYARRIMEDMNLCILMLEKEDIKSIINNPTSIVNIFNQQSEEAKKIKVL